MTGNDFTVSRESGNDGSDNGGRRVRSRAMGERRTPMDSRLRGNDGRCLNHDRVDGIIPASAGMTVVAATAALSMASFPLPRE